MPAIVSAPIMGRCHCQGAPSRGSGRGLAELPDDDVDELQEASVAAARVFSSHRAISLPSAASGQPCEGSSRCAVERYFATSASNPPLEG